MDPVILEWLNGIVRFTHVVAGIAWIGSSFYFVHLDLSLRAREGLAPGVRGEAWQVHGGGFYRMLKYTVAPKDLPDELTWFKWEAYSTWLSGFGLLVIVYYFGADLLLVDSSVLPMSHTTAIGASLATLVGCWLVYEGLCRSPLRNEETLLSVVGYVFLVGVAYGLTHVFSGRGTFLHLGALIGTIMVANVFVVIIPNQKKIVAALLAGEEPDPRLGEEGKRRSLHNNYLTLPVVFLMVSSHYPLTYATRFNWLIAAIVLAIGPVIRHFYNVRHSGKGDLYWPWAAAAAGAILIAILMTAGPPGPRRASLGAPPEFAAVAAVIGNRCGLCHAAEPRWPGLAHAPGDVRLDTPEAVRAHSRLVELYAVRSAAMPPGNLTGMEEEERRMIASWLAGDRKE